MLFAPPLKQASRHRELPDSLESLNPMFERHWRVIGERVEDADIRGAACHLNFKPAGVGVLKHIMQIGDFVGRPPGRDWIAVASLMPSQ